MSENENNLYDPNDVEMKMPEENFFATDEPTKTISVLPIAIFAIIIVLIGILGALLWWGSELFKLNSYAPPAPVATRPTAEQNNEPESTTAEAQVETLQAVSTSDDIYAIKADLDGINFVSFQDTMNIVWAEFDAFLAEQGP